jgi:hypothetical protein
MSDLQFEWARDKAADNARKHGVTFEEAETVFTDEFGILLDDPDHSIDEDRFVLLGFSAMLRTLVVVHCYRRPHDSVRLISARKATRKEREIYNRRWRT